MYSCWVHVISIVSTNSTVYTDGNLLEGWFPLTKTCKESLRDDLRYMNLNYFRGLNTSTAYSGDKPLRDLQDRLTRFTLSSLQCPKRICHLPIQTGCNHHNFVGTLELMGDSFVTLDGKSDTRIERWTTLIELHFTQDILQVVSRISL